MRRRSETVLRGLLICIGIYFVLSFQTLLEGPGVRLLSAYNVRREISLLPTAVHLPVPVEEDIILAKPFIRAILDAGDRTLDRLSCLTINGKRYDHLKTGTKANPGMDHRSMYIFALHTHDDLDNLPTIMGSVVEVARYLGPPACLVSVIDHGSTDGTYELLYALQSELEVVGLRMHLMLNTSAAPGLEESPSPDVLLVSDPREGVFLHDDAVLDEDHGTFVFMDNALACPEDILELIYQRRCQQAAMTCAMDWTIDGGRPAFRSVRSARDISGQTFHRVHNDDIHREARDLFWSTPSSRTAFEQMVPFQVYSCFNGLSVVSAKAVYGNRTRSRGPVKTECQKSASLLLCKGMWSAGFGRIAVVPSVNVAGGLVAADSIKQMKGYTSNNVQRETFASVPRRIDWQTDPPSFTAC